MARASSHAQSSRNRRPDLHSFCFSHCAQVKWLNKAEVHNSLLTGMELEEMGLGAMVRRFDHDIDQREALSLSRARSLSRSLARALSNPNAHFASCIQDGPWAQTCRRPGTVFRVKRTSTVCRSPISPHRLRPIDCTGARARRGGRHRARRAAGLPTPADGHPRAVQRQRLLRLGSPALPLPGTTRARACACACDMSSLPLVSRSTLL